ncbi:tetratricopeptide repeat protein [Treponema primitia]|uniref:tetratricopeptide repeat protein n=1 Tax=Treponema primitia TaxID=88058 RepID=UPI003980C793
MGGFIPILAVVVVLILGVFLAITIMGRSKGIGDDGSGKKSKGRDAILKDANKRLAQNPHDLQALTALGNLYYKEEAWDDAFKTYGILLEIAPGHQDANLFEINLHYGISALKKGLQNEAYKGLSAARVLKQDNFEVNFNLGVLEFQKKGYEKAIQLLQQARTQDPENPAALRYLGHSFFKLKKYREAMNFIRKAIEIAPDDKESLYTLAECYYDANQVDQALKIFSHLRPDPVMGPKACLFAGTINMNQHQEEKAILDFEIGLKHQSIKPDVLLELKYRLATLFLKRQEIGKALVHLKDIQSINASYKDVNLLIGKYQELNANKNLQIFLMAPSADFVALCRKVVMSFYNKAKTKITNIAVNKNEWADILADVDSPKWSDTVMFRFIRTPGSIGELILRDFHSHLKDAKAGKGICITVGNFSDEAKRFTEARLIDLIEKDRLSAILNNVDAKSGGADPGKKK